MKSIWNILILILFFFAPLFVYYELVNNFRHYDKIAAKYDCYPIETCKVDFDKDGNHDLITQKDNLTNGKHNPRFIVFLRKDGSLFEVLNLEYVVVDGTFRTHAAINEENSQARLVIYDTVNPQQYFIWNGEKLVPTEPTQTDLEIRKAMSLTDDTGGFNEKIFFDYIAIFFSAIYYLIFFIVVAVIYFQNKKTIRLKLN